jgi:iron complex outermembrane recepter protein
MSSSTRRARRLLESCVIVCCGTLPALAHGANSARELKRLSIEELMDVEVTSVSRTAEALGGAAAAIGVVTSEDLRRSGATAIPEALRGIPGINVGRRNSNTWAVSARGFSSVSSEKLLVLRDTRSVYTPLFSGVFWDSQDYLLEDVERIEVIRGPGASLWGSNAVNGVINITTKNARDTQGWYVDATLGTEEHAGGAVRYGGRLGESGFFRVFGKYFDRDASHKPGSPTSDDWRAAHGGFRADWDDGGADTFTVQGEGYRANIGQLSPSVTVIGRQGPQGDLTVRATGGNVLGRWRRALAEGSDMQLRAYVDHTDREDPSFHDDLTTFDVDFQHRFAPLSSHEVVWGLNYRRTDNRNRRSVIFNLDPADSQDDVISGFVQDQIALRDALRLTIGTKLEENDFSGFEVQPNVRLAWEVAPAHTAWAAVSRAARVPTRLERDVSIDITDPAADPVVRLLGNEDLDAEELVAYELGYRWQASHSLSVDAALFHNRYDGLMSLEIGTPFLDSGTGQVIIPVTNQNLTDGHSEGVELLVNFSPRENWRLMATYSNVHLSLDAGGMDLNRGQFLEGATPRHQFTLRSLLDLPHGFELDAQFRSLSRIEELPEIATGEGIAGYSELDVRLGWRSGAMEIALVGRNLLHDHHLEFGTPAARGEIERSVYGKVAWRF